MRFRIMGPLEVWSDEGWTAIGAAKWRSLLACLLLRRGQLVSTESLILELWGDGPPAKANNLVSIYVHRLRRLIGDTEGKVLVYRAPGYMLLVERGDLDLQEFESLVEDGRNALAAADPDTAAALLTEALGLWRGPLMADVPQSGQITMESERAVELRLTAAELRIEADLACGRSAQVVPELRRLVAENPIREGLWVLLMRALEGAGRHAEALDTYSNARQVISEELGVDPGPELQEMYARLLAADASSARPRRRPARPDTHARPQPATGGPAEADTGLTVSRDDRQMAAADETADEMPPGDVQGTISIGTFGELPAPLAAAPAEAPAGSPMPGPMQLPADIEDFTDREVPLRHLCGMLVQAGAAVSTGAVRIAVVAGAGGLGKTTLAVHAAHQVRTQFPDGQLYVDLSGATAQPAAPGEVLARFLRDLGVDGDRVPIGDDERAALYRTRLTGRRVLVMLDNARDAAQVRPLLPGSASCAVLVTTRNRTPDLASTRFVDLNVLGDDDALALFSQIVGDDRPAAEPDATAEVLVACAGLPLAIRICAARLAARRQWKIATLAGRLRDTRRRLDELKTGDLAVRASFQVSYDSLRTASRGTDPARAFRFLSLWQGPSISLPAAAALLGEPEADVADALETLIDANLVESPAPDWYRFHDLLRVYATERAQAEQSEAARGEAVGRLLQWYLATAEAAANTVSPHRYQVPSQTSVQVWPPLEFSTVEEALAWYDKERANVVAATRQAATAGLHDVAWRLPPTLFPVFNRRNNWADCVVTLRVALENAKKADERRGEAWILNQLGWALARLRDEEAFGHLRQALAIRQELGDSIGEAQTAIALGEVHLRVAGPGEAAREYMQHAADLLQTMDQPSLRGSALNNLGEVYFGLGNLDAAAECYAQARDIFHEIGGYGEGHALHNLGRVYLRLNRLDDAVAILMEAVRTHRATGDLHGEATALTHLGQMHLDSGNSAGARESWTLALAIFNQVDDRAEAAEVGAALASLPT
jgi:DNA-binding SARP family transcriptional activator